jgi:hypothetical protein
MKTKNLKLDLVLPGQLNKEVFFNENLSKIDSFICSSIRAFVPDFPEDSYKAFKFIISEGKNKNKICYAPTGGRVWKLIEPEIGMIFFCADLRSFFYFNGDVWDEIRVSSSIDAHSSEGASLALGTSSAAASEIGSRCEIERFMPSSGDHTVINPISWIYLNGHTNLIMRDCRSHTVELVIKQNVAVVYNVTFDCHILWKDGAYESSRTPNSMDYIRLVKIPETEHYLGQVVNTGYSY